MKKVFISSVIKDFATFRKAAKSAVEIMDLKPVMSEDFGARSYSSEIACIKEAQSCDLFILILGKNYGHLTSEGVSVTHSEYRAAKAANRPILAFVQTCDMEPQQEAFKVEVEKYHDGFFRATFSTDGELKDQIVKSLRNLEKEASAVSENDFLKRFENILQDTHSRSRNESFGAIAFWGQPIKEYDLAAIEQNADNIFKQLCDIGVTNMREGYKLYTKNNRIEITSNKTKFFVYDDGFKILYFSPTIEGQEGYSFSMFYVSPGLFERVTLGSLSLCESKISWTLLALFGMDNKYFAEPEKGDSTTIPMRQQSSEVVTKFLSPITKSTYEDWVKAQVKKLKWVFRKEK